MAADIALVALLVGGFFVGFFRGTIRLALALAAAVVCFIFAAYLYPTLGDWLARVATFSPYYADLVSFAVIFVGLFGAALVVILLSRTPTGFTRHAVVDDIVGGLLGVVTAAFVIAVVLIMLDLYYLLEDPAPAVDTGVVADLHRALGLSPVARFIDDTMVRLLSIVIGPLLPVDVRAVMS